MSLLQFAIALSVLLDPAIQEDPPVGNQQREAAIQELRKRQADLQKALELTTKQAAAARAQVKKERERPGAKRDPEAEERDRVMAAKQAAIEREYSEAKNRLRDSFSRTRQATVVEQRPKRVQRVQINRRGPRDGMEAMEKRIGQLAQAQELLRNSGEDRLARMVGERLRDLEVQFVRRQEGREDEEVRRVRERDRGSRDRDVRDRDVRIRREQELDRPRGQEQRVRIDRWIERRERHDGERHGGERHDGERHDGERHDGERHDGERHDGERHDGERHDGERRDGERHDGERHGGERHDGERHDGERHDGEWHDGERHDGEWHDGERHDGERHDGERHDGERHDGERHDGERHDGERHDGERHDGERHDGEQYRVERRTDGGRQRDVNVEIPRDGRREQQPRREREIEIEIEDDGVPRRFRARLDRDEDEEIERRRGGDRDRDIERRELRRAMDELRERLEILHRELNDISRRIDN